MYVSSNPQVSAPVPRPAVNGMERMSQRHGRYQTPTVLFESKTHKSINSYSKTYAVIAKVKTIAREMAMVE